MQNNDFSEYKKTVDKHYENPYCDKLSEKMKEKRITVDAFLNELWNADNSYEEEIKSKSIKLADDTFKRIQSGENGTKRETIELIAKVLSNIAKEEITPSDICTDYPLDYKNYFFALSTHAKQIKKNPKYKKYMENIKVCYDTMSFAQACKLAVFFDICYDMDEKLHELITKYFKLNPSGRKEILNYAYSRKITIEEQISSHGNPKINDYFHLRNPFEADVEISFSCVESKEDLWISIEEKIEDKLSTHPLFLSYLEKLSKYMLSFTNAVFSVELPDTVSELEYGVKVWDLAIAYSLLNGKKQASLLTKTKKLLSKPENCL